MVDIQVEIIAILFPILIFFLWAIWRKLSKIWSKRRYNPENDKGKKGEEYRRELIRRDKEFAEAESGIAGSSQSEERRILPTANIGSYGKDSNRPRGIFRRIRRRS